MRSFIYILLFLALAQSVQAQRARRISDKKINTSADEMAPMFYKNGIVFSSDRKSDVFVVAKDAANKDPYNLYFVEKKGRKEFSSPKIFSPNIKSKLSESSAVFNQSENLMYLTRTIGAEKKLSDLENLDSITHGIFKATKSGDDWVVTQAFEFNNEKYRIVFPFITPDGKTMYFCSDRPGGYGGLDIYKSEIFGGSWQDPENMGDVINTPENEVFPFYHQSGRLYFSSRGHKERGTDLDIYYTEIIEEEWIKPVSLPLNRNRVDDFGLILKPEMDSGYFVSNRYGSDDLLFALSEFPAFEECPEQFVEKFCYTLEETNSYGLDTNDFKFEWDFGDGHRQRSLKARHCYDGPGKYTVALNVIDAVTGDIQFSEATYELNVVPKEMAFMIAPDTAYVGQKITLDGSKSIVNSFTPKDYYWDLGDGNVEEDIDIDYTYKRPGKFYIRLGVTDGQKPSEEDEDEGGQKTCSLKEIIVIKNE